MSDVISRQVAISAICSACGKIDCDKMDKCEKLQLPPVNSSEIPNSSDTISRAKAIEALKNDMASLDHIIKGMSANDVRLDAYVSQRNQVNYDIYTINNLPPAQPEQLGTNLAEVGTDCISRQAALVAVKDALMAWSYMPEWRDEKILEAIAELPPTQPEHIKGHWICDRSWSEGVGMGESYGHYWKCDKCGHLEQGDWGECGCNFCSNCGSDNREVTE